MERAGKTVGVLAPAADTGLMCGGRHDVTLNLKPEIEAGLQAQAKAADVKLEEYLQRLVEKEIPAADSLFARIVRRFFDSSVLIPAFYRFDDRHNPSAKALRAASREDSSCALRTLGEVYAVLTGLPVRPRLTGGDGVAVLEQIVAKLTMISLTGEEYVSAIRSVSRTIVGGAAYDALIVRCAIKAGAEILLTWNVRDF